MPMRCGGRRARFGARIVQERVFEDTGGARRTDSGVVQVQRQIPVFTQEAPAYDVLVAADESEVFADYLPYRTWDAAAGRRLGRPDADQLGRVPRSMGRHTRCRTASCARFSRRMTALDMQAWSAVRMIGEAASRTRSADPKTHRSISSRDPISRSPPSRASG